MTASHIIRPKRQQLRVRYFYIHLPKNGNLGGSWCHGYEDLPPLVSVASLSSPLCLKFNLALRGPNILFALSSCSLKFLNFPSHWRSALSIWCSRLLLSFKISALVPSNLSIYAVTALKSAVQSAAMASFILFFFCASFTDRFSFSQLMEISLREVMQRNLRAPYFCRSRSPGFRPNNVALFQSLHLSQAKRT